MYILPIKIIKTMIKSIPYLDVTLIVVFFGTLLDFAGFFSPSFH